MVMATQIDWDVHLPMAMLAYRSSIHESTGYSPSMMMLGREAELPADLLFGPPPQRNPEEVEPHHYIQELEERLHLVHSVAREQLVGAAEQQRRGYEINLKELRYEEGDLVWLYQPAVKRGTSPKFHLPWDGPFVVTKRLSDLVYQVQDGPRSRLRIVHHNRLKPHYGQAPVWQEKRRAELQGKADHEATAVGSEDTGPSALPDGEGVSRQAEEADQPAGDSKTDIPPDDSAGVSPAQDSGENGEEPEATSSDRQSRRRRRPAYLDDYEA